ncbi:hypothetical protein BJY52DRAFT_1224619 [Lactarius psammicola]|nr:hypothetical protein BJY52DRAFT_1224619 [Lactarius psammicola]
MLSWWHRPKFSDESVEKFGVRFSDQILLATLDSIDRDSGRNLSALIKFLRRFSEPASLLLRSTLLRLPGLRVHCAGIPVSVDEPGHGETYRLDDTASVGGGEPEECVPPIPLCQKGQELPRDVKPIELLSCPRLAYFKAIFDDALKEYEKKTGTNLTAHPLADKLRTCDSPDAVLNVLQDHIRAYEESRNGDRRLTKLLDPTIHVLYLLSAALGEGVGLAFGPAKVIFAGFSVLLATAKAAKAGHEALVDLFERVGSFLGRLKIYSGIPLTTEINEVFGKIMVEVLSILALSTKEMERGRTNIEDALRRLDKLTQEEARMVLAQVLKFTHDLMSGDQSREKHRGWLSPPNPSVNHNVACDAHQGGTTAWLPLNDSLREWQKSGSLLWIHGKPGSGKSIIWKAHMVSTSSAVIEDIKRMHDEKPALIAYYYFDFRDTTKQHARGLLSSLLIQLCDQSDRLCDTLSDLYSKHYRGSQQPSDSALVGCLKDMLRLLGQAPLYIILDALDECPHGVGTPSARESVLELVKELVDLRYPNRNAEMEGRG